MSIQLERIEQGDNSGEKWKAEVNQWLNSRRFQILDLKIAVTPSGEGVFIVLYDDEAEAYKPRVRRPPSEEKGKKPTPSQEEPR